MQKFMEWFSRNRRSIGYTIGGLNVLSGLGQVADGNLWPGVIWIVLGLALILDAYEFK